MPGMLKRCLHAITLPIPADATLDGAAAAPEWVQLVPAGAFTGRDGRGPFRLDAAAVLAAFERGGIDLPVDYDHQTLQADAKAGPVPAAGWIKALEVREGSLWGRVAWTEKAAALIAQREYRFLSPVFLHDKTGRVLALNGAGLTHYPNLDLTAVANANEGVTRMDEELMERLRALLNLPTLAGPADIVAELEKLVQRLKTAEDQAQAANARLSATEPDPAQWVPMSQHSAVAQQLSALQRQVAKAQAEDAVRAAMSAGKLVPALLMWAQAYAEKDPEGFAAWVTSAPVIVEPAAHSQRVAPNAGTADALTEEDRIACQLLGMREADFAAHKKTLERAHA